MKHVERLGGAAIQRSVMQEHSASPAGTPRKIPVSELDDPFGTSINVNTSFESQDHVLSPPRRKRQVIRNIGLSVAALLVLILAGGVIYIWHADQYTHPLEPSTAASANISKLTSSVPARTTPEESVVLMSFSNPIKRGESTSLYIQTLGLSVCSIDVAYNNTVDRQAALNPVTADSSGSLSWTWTPPVTAPNGDWPVTITCVHNGKPAVLKQTLTIMD